MNCNGLAPVVSEATALMRRAVNAVIRVESQLRPKTRPSANKDARRVAIQLATVQPVLRLAGLLASAMLQKGDITATTRPGSIRTDFSSQRAVASCGLLSARST